MSKVMDVQMEDKDVGSSTGSAEMGSHLKEKRTKRSRVMGICKRFWWAFLIVLIVGVLAVTLPLVFVGFPKIIQDKMNDAQVSMQGLRISQPKANSVYMEMNSTITSGGGISAVIDPFNASLYLEDKADHIPFAYLQMPKTSADKLVVVNVSQTLEIWNMEAYTEFNTVFLLNESFRVTLNGDTDVHVKGLRSTRVNFRKTVTLKGLNGFKGLNVTSVEVSLKADAKGDNMHGTATIPNPSILTVEIGNVTFSNMLNNTKIGQLFIDDLTLSPGTNTVPIRANISQAPVLSAVTGPLYCKTGVVPFQLIGETVITNGTNLPYYESGFKQNLQEVPLNVSAALAVTLGSPVGCASTS